MENAIVITYEQITWIGFLAAIGLIVGNIFGGIASGILQNYFEKKRLAKTKPEEPLINEVSAMIISENDDHSNVKVTNLAVTGFLIEAKKFSEYTKFCESVGRNVAAVASQGFEREIERIKSKSALAK